MMTAAQPSAPSARASGLIGTAVGPATVVVVELDEERRRFATDIGADLVVHPDATHHDDSKTLLLSGVLVVTGTATDAVCIACPDEGAPHAFGGPRSLWGARLARAVHAAGRSGIRP